MLWGIDSCSHHPEPVAYALKTRLISLVHFSFIAEEAAMLSCAKLKYFGLTGVKLHGTLSPIFTCQVSIGVTVWSAFTSLWPSVVERGRSWWENGSCTTTCWFQHGSSDELFFGTWGLPYHIAVWWLKVPRFECIHFGSGLNHVAVQHGQLASIRSHLQGIAYHC